MAGNCVRMPFSVIVALMMRACRGSGRMKGFALLAHVKDR